MHHIQLDDFGDEDSFSLQTVSQVTLLEDYFLLGPMDSGFNSRTLALSDRKET